MTEPITPPVPTPPVAPVVVTPVTPVEVKPPWGSPEEFDAEKAWALITKLRDQKNDPAAAKKISDLEGKVAAFEDANRTETERVQARAEAAEKTAAEAAVQLARMKAVVKFGLTEDDLELLGTGTAEEIEARAEKLSARLKGIAPTTPLAPSANGQGNVGGSVHSESEPIKALDAQIEAATAAGNHALAIQLKQHRSTLILAKP